MNLYNINNYSKNKMIIESDYYIIMHKCESEILYNIMSGILKNVIKIVNYNIPIIIINESNSKTLSPELLFYKRNQAINSLVGIRQVDEIVNFIDNSLNL